MSLTRTCARCAAPLPDETPEGVVCEDCAAVLESEQTMATPTPGSRGVSYRLPPQAPRAEVLGDFEIGEKLGQGGMGAVYRARQITLDRVVALKVLPEYFAADEENVARFQREARIAAGFVHANIVHVFSAGIIDGTHFIAMELVEGENLRQRMKRERLSVAEALYICGEVARGLQYGWESAHLVHRDIKPGNIFLSTDGAVKVGDLGLAKSLSTVTSGLTQTGTSLGTALYMSPEQVRGDRTFDFRSDIYSLGCTLYEMLTGQPPYTGNDGMAVMRMHLDAPLPAILKAMPGCPIPLARLVGRMLKKNARERHGSYADLIAEIEMVREQLEAGAGATGPSAVVEAWKQAADIEAAPAVGYGLLWAGLTALLLIGGGVAFFAFGKKKEPVAAKSTLVKASATPPSATPSLTNSPSAPPAPSAAKLATTAPPPAAGAEPGWMHLWTREGNPREVGPDGIVQLDRTLICRSEKMQARDAAVRATVRVTREMEGAEICLRATGDSSETESRLILAFATPDRTTLHVDALQPGKKKTQLESWDLSSSVKEGDWLPVEFRAVGDQISVSAGGRLLGTVRSDAVMNEGSIRLGGRKAQVRDIDGLNLDGTGTSSPAAAATTTTAAPYPEPGSDGNPVFKPGIWMRLWTAEHETRRIVQREGDWIRFDNANGGEPQALTNFGVRARFRGQRTIERAIPQLNLRSRGVGGVNLNVPGDGAKLQIRRLVSGFPILAEIRLQRALSDPSREYAMEFYAIGHTLIGRIDDETVTAEFPEKPTAGPGGIYGTNNDFFRDAQLINLDGLSEAEALKLAGSPSSATTSTPPPRTSASTQQWENLLLDPEMQAKVQPAKDGVLVRTMATVARGQGRNGFVKARLVFSKDAVLSFRLVACKQETSWYQGLIRSDGSGGVIQYVTGTSSRDYHSLPEQEIVPLARPLVEGQAFDTELRVVGDALHMSINGQLVYKGRHSELPGGRWGVSGLSTAPVVVQSVEYFEPPSGASATPATPENAGWQPLLSDAEWKAKGDRREFQDGLVHFSNWGSSMKPMSSPDGAIRARITYREGSTLVCLIARENQALGNYKLVAEHTAIALNYYSPNGGEEITTLHRHNLSRQLQPGDTFMLELRLKGNQLTAVYNDAVLFEIRDDRLKEAGNWGIYAKEGWFQSAEVRTLAEAASTPATATKDAPFVNSLGMKFVPVPITGGPTDGKRVLFSVWETRVQDYEVYATATPSADGSWQHPRYQQSPTHPVTNVSGEDGAAFCLWLTEHERKAGKLAASEVYRLPSDHEWSCAVGIGDREDPSKTPGMKNDRLSDAFPWGSGWPPPAGAGNYFGADSAESSVWPGTSSHVPIAEYRDGFPEMAPVGSFPANRFGIFDLGGNVSEWCEVQDPSAVSYLTRGAAGTTEQRTRMLSSHRDFIKAVIRADSRGFRVVLAPAP